MGWSVAIFMHPFDYNGFRCVILFCLKHPGMAGIAKVSSYPRGGIPASFNIILVWRCVKEPHESVWHQENSCSRASWAAVTSCERLPQKTGPTYGGLYCHDQKHVWRCSFTTVWYVAFTPLGFLSCDWFNDVQIMKLHILLDSHYDLMVFPCCPTFGINSHDSTKTVRKHANLWTIPFALFDIGMSVDLLFDVIKLPWFSISSSLCVPWIKPGESSLEVPKKALTFEGNSH